MATPVDQRITLRKIAGSVILIVSTCVLYGVFVFTLFAGFTADIQRDFLGRELGASTPGKLERIVLQSYLEAGLRQDLQRLRRDLRGLETASVGNAQVGLGLRKDAIAGWWAAYDKYAELRETVAGNRAAFDPGFVADLNDGVNRAFALVTDLEVSGLEVGSLAAGDGNAVWQDDIPLGLLDVPFGEEDDDAERRAAGIHIMVELRRVIEQMRFAPDVDPAFQERIEAEVERIRAVAKAFDAKSVRAQIEWTNIRAGRAHEDRLRAKLNADIAETSGEIELLEREGGAEYRALVALFAHPVGSALFYLIQLPTIMLTLLVTVAAGGLGAVVAFTRDNFTRRTKMFEGDGVAPAAGEAVEADAMDEGTNTNANAAADVYPGLEPGLSPGADADGWASVARLLVLTGEGIAAAIAIFLFTEAGMLMLTQGGPDGTGQVDISPYLLTFMAFVSGFMAEDAFARIQFAGQKLFRVTGDREPK
ncbi:MULTISPECIES: hypothetical protein [Thalassospira]|uniref:Uncharacterized protein n=2 Tax=Thalassospira TaxID=168934 RepID=A0A367W925_9PROT|nr:MULTISPECIES: hypothetical protein [Thalassospira]MDG4718182.1 hypothetical protein [Thalassospira sp. FZY0004]RCK37945.1 hypothetical protein TH19_07960 [Thalassospira profundimaris]